MVRSAILITVSIAMPALAETLYVPTEHLTIQSALDVAQPGDVVEIAAGTYTESDLLPGGLDITVRGAVDSEGMPAVVIDGSGEGIIFMCGVVGTDGVVLENIHFKGSTGNAVWIYHHAPTIRNCTFSGFATGADGAAIWSMDSGALIEGCRFLNNTVGKTGNVVHCGGNFSSTCPTLRDCVFSGNTGASTLSVRYCDPTIEGCSFTGNSGALGGGMMMFQSAATIRNCEFTANTSTTDGGGVYLGATSNPEFIECIFSNNSALEHGGGIYCMDGSIQNFRTLFFAAMHQTTSLERG